MLQPIVVRNCSSGYEVVFGRHRIEAIRRLGVKTVTAIISSMSEAEAFIARLSENLVRNTYVDPIEEALGYRMLVGDGWTINAIANKLGKWDSYVSERLSLLDRLDPGVRSRISDKNGHITASHAELISRIQDSSKQREVADFVEKKRLSVRGLEDILNGVPPPMKILVEREAGKSYVRIPSQFLESIQYSPDGYLHMYVRGRKLILENIERSRSDRRKHPLNPTLTSHVRTR